MTMPIIIGGPCSWESPKQAKTIIDFLCGKHNIKYIRGGFKKYRSDPSTFQGVGIFDGVEMLDELKKKYKFKLVVEVFTDNDMLALKDFADIWQIGSRNAYNTDLLRETNQYSKPVLYKRHYAMGLKEMVKHAEYIENETIMCLRGDLSIHLQEQRFRSDMADIQRLRELTKNKICYDVSHSSCESRFVEKNCLSAMVYEPDMISLEVHNKPSEALSDPQQQLDFKQFESLLSKIKQKEEIKV